MTLLRVSFFFCNLFLVLMKSIHRFAPLMKITLIIGLFLTQSAIHAAEDPLPQAPLPIGYPAHIETRTVTELRPGLTHVNIKRGPWQKDRGGAKYTFIMRNRTREDSAELRACLEQYGYIVYEQVSQDSPEGEPKYTLTAGEFSTTEELIKAAKGIPCEVQIGKLYESPGKEMYRPIVLDIVVLDPKAYQGKIVAAWSEEAWPASPLELAIMRNAVVAINGSFFDYLSHGLLAVPSAISIAQGVWHHEHYPERKRFNILFIERHEDGNTTVSIGREPPPFPKFKWGEGRDVELDGIDRFPEGNELIAIKSSFFVNAQERHGNIPKSISWLSIKDSFSGADYYIMATGSKRWIVEEARDSSLPVELFLGVPGRPGLNALYITPTMIVDGTLCDVVLSPLGSRTSVGADAEGKIYLVVAQEDLSEYDSSGVDFHELRDIGEYLGLVNFGNLDGGGSSTSMVIEGQFLGAPDTPIYDHAHKVSDSILIIDE